MIGVRLSPATQTSGKKQAANGGVPSQCCRGGLWPPAGNAPHPRQNGHGKPWPYTPSTGHIVGEVLAPPAVTRRISAHPVGADVLIGPPTHTESPSKENGLPCRCAPRNDKKRRGQAPALPETSGKRVGWAFEPAAAIP